MCVGGGFSQRFLKVYGKVDFQRWLTADSGLSFGDFSHSMCFTVSQNQSLSVECEVNCERQRLPIKWLYTMNNNEP